MTSLTAATPREQRPNAIEWRAARLGEICRVVGGSTPRSGVSEYWDGEIVWMTPADLGRLDGVVIDSSARRITRAGYESCSTEVVPPGSVVLSSRAPIGHLGVAGVPLCTNQGCKTLVPGRGVDSRFLYYALKHAVPVLRALGTGATFPEISKSTVEQFTIGLPPLPEQRRIVALLDEAAALRRLRDAADRRTAALVPAIFYEMFGELSGGQSEWPMVPVSRLVDRFQAGKSLASDGAESDGTRYRVLKISAVTSGGFRPNESKPVPVAYQPSETHFVRAGDLLFSRANTAELVGATAFVDSTPANLLLPDKLWRFAWRKPCQAEPLYVWSLFSQPTVRRTLSELATGTSGSMKNISQAKLLGLAVPLPPLHLQREFAARVTAVRALEDQQRAARARLDALNASMLARAFRGEL